MGNKLNRTFSVEEIQMGKKHMKKCSPSLAIKEMQIKSTLRLYFTSVRIATIKNTKINKYWCGCGEKGIIVHCWWDSKLVQPLWNTIWRLHKKIEIDLPLDPVILLSLQQRHLHCHVYCSAIHNS
jgi:hypothetical protein